MANVNIQVDENLKNQADVIFANLGIDCTVATNIFLKQVVRHNGLPFEIRIDPFYSSENQKRLLIAKERMANGGGTPHELIEDNDDYNTNN